MTTWQGFSSGTGAATTRWNYHAQRGWLASKDYPDASTGSPPGTEGATGPVYTYTSAGRLLTRVWKRGVTTAYAYSNAGDLQSLTYTGGSVSTPTTTYTFDRRGRRKTAVRNGITTTWTYNDADQPLTESLSKVLNGSASATYGYLANSTHIATVALTNGTGQGLGVSRAYDKLNRLQTITSRAYGSAATNLPVSFDYLYNRANQRTRATLGDGAYWGYLYDHLGQVVSGRRYWQDGTEVLGQQFEYRFDDIGNRVTAGGRVSSLSAYMTNRLNQYTSRTVPPHVEVMGIANPTTNVTVNGNVAARKGEYFHHALSVPNSTAQYPTITVTSQYGSGQSRTGEVFVAASLEAYAYDADGNLTSDGRWTYEWDGENRLTRMVRDTSTPTLSSRLKLEFEYDHQGRRIRKQFFTYSGSAWVEQRDTICLYEGWNVMAELNANASNAKLRTYVWGSDLSGTVEGAGGVGGLLWLNNYQTTYDGQSLPTGVHFVAYDGNGNVAALTRASDGSVSARYEYGPFGESLRQTGALADAQPFRFSTKWTDAETGLLYYGYRFYNPVTGRWPNRDPMEEEGGLNLYDFTDNDPLSAFDVLGQKTETIKVLGASWKFKSNRISAPSKKKRSNVTGSTIYGLFPLDAFVTEKGCEKGKKHLGAKGTAYKVDYWYTDNASQHFEETNVGILRDNWRTYGLNVDALAGCVCPPCADCRLELALLFQKFYTAWSTVQLLERDILIQGITSRQPDYAAMVQARDKLQKDIEGKRQECARKCE